MQISGKLILFVQDKKDKENHPFKTFSTTISSKRNEEYVNKSMEVRFNTENIPVEKTNKLKSSMCYTLEVENAWLGVREYKNKENEEIKVFYIYIDKATITGSKEIAVKSEDNDLPF